MAAVPPAYPKPVLVSTPPAPGVPSALPTPVHSRPKTVGLRCKALRSLPYRLMHPPPARGKVTTWGVVPRFEVRLDDILDRKHLPPLGLKDFEEWLLFVEQSAENLYFILWLREYTQRYSEWVRSTKLTRTSSYGSSHRREYRTPSELPTPKPELTYSYIRAKQTFLTPNGNYELDVPSDVLTPFHVAPGAKGTNTLAHDANAAAAGEDALSENAHTAWSATTCVYGITYGYGSGSYDGAVSHPPPDPAVFGELAEIVRGMLNESLQRFVLATYNNVGTPRAVYGSAGGIGIGLAGSVPLIVNFAIGGSRWWRLAALPGMWVGLTIFITAMYGVCMMIYVFGDLRQLRSFELVRPPISDPQPHPSPSASVSSLFQPRLAPAFTQLIPFRRSQRRSLPEISSPMSVRPPSDVPYVSEKAEAGSPKLQIVTPGSRWSEESTVPPPQRAVTRSLRHSRVAERGISRVSSLASISDADCSDDDDAHDSGYEDERPERRSAPHIEISDAFYDEHPSPEGPATASFPGPGVRMPGAPLWPDYVGSDEEELNATAAFIHPFSYEDALKEKEGELGLDLEAQTGRGVAARQPVDAFDFDALPPRRPRFANPGRHRGAQAHASPYSGRGARSEETRVRSAKQGMFNPRAVMGRWQSKCSPENVVRVHIEREIEREHDGEKGGWGIGWGVASSPVAPSPTVTLAGSPVAKSTFTFPAVSMATTIAPAAAPVRTDAEPETEKEVVEEETEPQVSWHKRFRRVRAVPAFAVPLTPVLNPVVTRAQWEIVVRSALIAFLVCAVVVGGLTGVPVPHHR